MVLRDRRVLITAILFPCWSPVMFLGSSKVVKKKTRAEH